MPVENIHDYIWYKITDFKTLSVTHDLLKSIWKMFLHDLFL